MADDPTQSKTLEMRVAELEDRLAKLQAPAPTAVGQMPVCACAMAAHSPGMAPVCVCQPHPAAYVCACVPHPAAYVCACVCANVCACVPHPAAYVCACVCANVCACVSTSSTAAPASGGTGGAQNPPSSADFGKLGS